MSNKLYPKKVVKDNEDNWDLYNYEIKKSKELSAIYKDMAHRLMQLHSVGSNFISRQDNNEVFEMAYSLRYMSERIADKYEYDPIILDSLYDQAVALVDADKTLISIEFLMEKLNCSKGYAKKIYKMIAELL
jgi:hypothetical protein